MRTVIYAMIEIVSLTFFILALFFVVLLIGEKANGATREEVELLIREVAISQSIDPDLAVAIAEVESGMNPLAIGKRGEVGVFQLHPEFHQVERDLKSNIEAAIRYLSHIKIECLPKYGGAWFIGFNVGPYYTKQIRYPYLFPYYVRVMQAKRKLAMK